VQHVLLDKVADTVCVKSLARQLDGPWLAMIGQLVCDVAGRTP
jgi:hypothetical protein